MLTYTFKARKSRSAQNRSMSANESFIKLARSSQSLGLDAFNVAGDGHCFFRTLSITLVDLLGSKAATLLLQVDCSHTALRDFLCSWAEDHHDDVVDDEGEETLAQRAADAALAWERPVAAIDDDGRVIYVEANGLLPCSLACEAANGRTSFGYAQSHRLPSASRSRSSHHRARPMTVLHSISQSGCRIMRCASFATWPSWAPGTQW